MRLVLTVLLHDLEVASTPLDGPVLTPSELTRFIAEPGDELVKLMHYGPFLRFGREMAVARRDEPFLEVMLPRGCVALFDCRALEPAFLSGLIARASSYCGPWALEGEGWVIPCPPCVVGGGGRGRLLTCHFL